MSNLNEKQVLIAYMKTAILLINCVISIYFFYTCLYIIKLIFVFFIFMLFFWYIFFFIYFTIIKEDKNTLSHM